MSFINVYQDERGLWSASLCRGRKELENIGGSYPKSNSAKLDAQYKWGREFEVKVSWSPMFISDKTRKEIIRLLSDGVGTKAIADKLKLKIAIIRAYKAHSTMGTYSFLNGGAMVSTG